MIWQSVIGHGVTTKLVCKECFYNIYGIKVIDNKCSECGKEITGNAYVHSINYTERYCSEKCLAKALGCQLVEEADGAC